MSKVLKSALRNDLEKEYHDLDGLYFSNVSLQIFEAKVVLNSVIVRYVDDADEPKVISLAMFHIQNNFELYQPLALYA